MRRIVFCALTAAVALIAATGAGAATSPSYQVAAIGTGGAQGTMSFLGTAVGSTGDRGLWQARVTYDSLTGSLTGGTFGLRSKNASPLTGNFTGGNVTPSSPAANGCGPQQFSVVGSIATSAGVETLTAVLTQYRLPRRGACVPFLATLQGTLDLVTGESNDL